MDRVRVALLQTELGADKQENVDKVVALIEQAAEQDPDLVALPENFSYFGTTEEIIADAETLDGPTLTRLRKLAAQYRFTIIAGTMKLRFPERKQLLNTVCVIKPDGEIGDLYHKVHIFEANVGGISYEGRLVEEPGDELIVADVKGVPVGLSVCYDLRFPELFRILTLRGAKIMCVPALFTLHTGKDHWETLLRARAIENQVYMIAPGICGRYPPHQAWSYGRSMIVDPWGLVIAQAQDKPGVICADLDLTRIDEVRKMVPSLQHRRPQAYRWPD